MKTTTIADAKNQLSNLIHQLENGGPVHLTRYGKPVAVMMSESQYQKLMMPQKSLHAAIQNWRSGLSGDEETGFNADELKTLRKESQGREFTWDD